MMPRGGSLSDGCTASIGGVRISIWKSDKKKKWHQAGKKNSERMLIYMYLYIYAYYI